MGEPRRTTWPSSGSVASARRRRGSSPAAGVSVLGLEQFSLGHDRGASHDTSRILRHSYHTPGYVALTFEAYDDWADLEDASGEQSPPSPVAWTSSRPGGHPVRDYTSSMDAFELHYDVLDAAEVARSGRSSRCQKARSRCTRPGPASCTPRGRSRRRSGWPQRAEPPCVENARVTALRPTTSGRGRRRRDDVLRGVGRGLRRRLDQRLLEPLGCRLPLTVTEEQVTYFEPADPRPSPRTVSPSGSGWTSRRSTGSRRTARPT